MMNNLKTFIKEKNLNGYIVPKNDEYFTEYSSNKNLSKLTAFTGSAGFALILKKKNYLFVDGRYVLQANKQSSTNFKIIQIPITWPKNLITIKNTKIGFDPKLFTKKILMKYFGDCANLVPISYNFKNKGVKNSNKFFQIDKKITGESSKSKIKKLLKFMKEKKIDYLYLSASENVCWTLNIRGSDLPNSPIANCKMIISIKGKIFLFSKLNKISLIKKKMKNINFLNEKDFFNTLCKLKKGNFCIDENTCSIFDQSLIESNFKVTHKIDPIYHLKSIKNDVEIKNTLNSHILDGIALTKFLFWFKKNEKIIDERKIEKKLEQFRKRSKFYMYPSFDTIAGSGPNGAIIHYKSTVKSNRRLKKNDILLIDSGGQYKWGTTDVTRTVCKGKISSKIKNNFTRVLKGHIAVANCNINKNYNGHLIDKLARKPLINVGLDYSHGTGHGVGFFLNVHEGPQSISKNNNILLKKGMILSNEPGYYLKNKYGIRLENLIYVDQIREKLIFKNLTFAPIDTDMINFNILNKHEKKYLFDYHLEVYFRISKFLNNSERKWLLSLLK
ncbi:aminopeptidase P family protein [Candidatus Pelagibacter sp.]|nr:aminopeptidase P family protein [Candidatus Pelagibacter sp.]